MDKLNFSCGTEIKETWDNCDIQKKKGVIYLDANRFPYSVLEDNKYDHILMRQCLQYFKYPDRCLYELWKKCKPKATIEIIVPYYRNKGAYNDLGFHSYFTDATFINFADRHYSYDKNKFKIVECDLIPTWIGRFIPKYPRRKLDLFLGGLIANVEVKLEIIK